jgi:hypothetical protein
MLLHCCTAYTNIHCKHTQVPLLVAALSGMLFTAVVLSAQLVPAVSALFGMAPLPAALSRALLLAIVLCVAGSVAWDRAVVARFDPELAQERAKAPLLSARGKSTVTKTLAAMAFAGYKLWQSAHELSSSSSSSSGRGGSTTGIGAASGASGIVLDVA